MNLLAFAALAVHHLAPWLPARAVQAWAAEISAEAETIEQVAANAATVAGESSFDPSVKRCDTIGKAGEVSAWQLSGPALKGHTPEEVCADPKLAAKLGRAKLGWLRRVTGSWRVALYRYVGAVTPDDPRAAKRLAYFDRIMQEVPTP